MIGIDVGGTRLKVGAVTHEGTLSLESVHPSGYGLGADALLRTMIEAVERIRSQARRDPEWIALGFPGAVDPQVGVVLLPGKLQVEGFPMVSKLAAATGVPVIADNDGRLSILAESRYGRAKGHKWAVSVTIGTGVGTGVLLDGRVLRDPHFQFGTQGSHIVQQSTSDRLCITRARGTANILCSATALSIIVHDGLARGLPSLLNEQFFSDPGSIDFKAVIAGVDQGDALCVDALHTWRMELGWFLVSMVHAYAPEIIVLSGGAAHASDHFLEYVQHHVNRHTYRYPTGEPVPVVVSELSSYCGVLGAAALAWEQVNNADPGRTRPVN